MFSPASLFIGLRYTRAKKRNHFISFISLVSMIGIALGVAVLITVLSVMNGFDEEIKDRVFSMVPAITINSTKGGIANWRDAKFSLDSINFIKATAPFVSGQVLISYGGSVQPAMINGVLPEQEPAISDMPQKLIKGKLTDLKPNGFGIVLGKALAMELDVKLGDKVTVVTPQVTLTPAGVVPRYKRFTVIGIFNAGNGFGFDRSLGFIDLTDAQKLFGMGDTVSGLHINIANPFQAPKRAADLARILEGSIVTTWADQFGELFHAVQLEKRMMFLILLLIVAVAAFNLVSTLVMVVNEKQSDIAILRTYGATPNMIMWIFIVQGGLIGLCGTLLGMLAGIALSMNVTSIVNWIESVFHVQFLSSDIYFVNYLPSKIDGGDVYLICLSSFVLCLLATIYPAWRASKLDPVESLRYE